MPAKSEDSKPLPLSHTLHDLAVLRASDVDLASLLPAASDPDQGMKEKPEMDPVTPSNLSAGGSEHDRLVENSFDYVREGRAAIRLLHREDVDNQGARADKVRGELEQILDGLSREDVRP